jgi:hypothetical protein
MRRLAGVFVRYPGTDDRGLTSHNFQRARNTGRALAGTRASADRNPWNSNPLAPVTG